MIEGLQQWRYTCDDPVVMGVYGPGKKAMSGQTVILDLQMYHPIQPHTPFFIQCTMGPSRHVGRRCEHELQNSQSAQHALQPHNPVKL